MSHVVIVGGGIIGTMHALEALSKGFEVTQLEKNMEPEGASVRNLGLIWVSGRAAGHELQLALIGRRKWEELGAAVPDIGFRPHGSLTALTNREEYGVGLRAMDLPDATTRGFELLDRDELASRFPFIDASNLFGGLFGSKDAIVEPRAALDALRRHCGSLGRYVWLPTHEVVGVHDHGVVDTLGKSHDADLVVICPGAVFSGPWKNLMTPQVIGKTRLQMLQTEPTSSSVQLQTSIADGDSFRYYPAYDLTDLLPQSESAARWAAQLLLVQRLDGSLTIGDTHERNQPFPFDLDAEPEAHLLAQAATILRAEIPPVARRWFGIYSQLRDPNSSEVYFRRSLAKGVEVVTGLAGRGMTLSPAVAQETFERVAS